jgi:hypothetical protein
MNPNLHDEIAKVAYDLYQKEGCPEGRNLIHWLEAEKIVKEQYAESPGGASGRTADSERPNEKKATNSRSGSRKKRNP